MEEDNTNYTFKVQSIGIDYHLKYEWVEFSWNKYTESFLCPNNDIESYEDIDFLFLYENDNNEDEDEDIFFSFLCEEIDEIFSACFNE